MVFACQVVLVLPHFVVLVFFWAGFALPTLVAFFAALFGAATRAGSSLSAQARSLVVARQLHAFRGLGTASTCRLPLGMCPSTRHGSRSNIPRTYAEASHWSVGGCS